MSPVKSTATISAIIAVAVIVVIVWILAQVKITTSEPVVPTTDTTVPVVTTTDVPADGEPATVTDVKPLVVTPVTE